MAIVNPTITDVSGDGSVMMFTYALTTADHTGAPLEWTKWADRTVLFQSVAWGGATAAVEGSNDGSVYIGLADGQGTAITKTANGLETAVELTRYMRPRLTTVGTAAAITVSVICRRNQPMRT